ncbi:MAG: hypothetical protein U0836_24040 [Pirellulales bacterium]
MDEDLLNLVKAATWLTIARSYCLDERRMNEAIGQVCQAVDAVLDRADELERTLNLEPSDN